MLYELVEILSKTYACDICAFDVENLMLFIMSE